MTTKDILSRKVITISPTQVLSEAMKLLIEKKISCLPVLEGNRLIGIISDKDIFRKVSDTDGKYHDLKVRDCMTTNLIIALPSDDIGYVASVMTENRIRHIPVCDDGQMIGLVSLGDVVKTQIEKVKVENRYLKEYISGNYPG